MNKFVIATRIDGSLSYVTKAGLSKDGRYAITYPSRADARETLMRLKSISPSAAAELDEAVFVQV